MSTTSQEARPPTANRILNARTREEYEYLNQSRLEALSCECYQTVKREFTRLVGSNGYAV